MAGEQETSPLLAVPIGADRLRTVSRPTLLKTSPSATLALALCSQERAYILIRLTTNYR